MTQPSGANIHDEGRYVSSAEYLRRAHDADDEGNRVLSMHLYLAAFERSLAEDGVASDAALGGLRKAWSIALESKERSLAEYIFEKLESYLTNDELAQYADQLQGLALDKLEEFGLSRYEVEETAAALSEGFLNTDAHIIKIESVGKASHRKDADAIDVRGEDAAADDDEDAEVVDEAEETPQASTIAAAAFMFANALNDGDSDVAEMPSGYKDLIGYDNAVRVMREMGVGMGADPEYRELVAMLNRRHGLDRMPALDTILFRSMAREDANYFMMATVGELELPSVRMHMEENVQGLPVLCVTAQADSPLRLSMLHETFEGGGVLILEDIDLWSAPLTEMTEEMNGFFMMQMSRGAREAMRLIRSAVENPDIYVMASCSTENDISGYFLNLLEPLTIVPIDLPTAEERVDIWMDLAKRHPSLRAISRVDLVRLSSQLPRFDIYMAAREAMEEAYKFGLANRAYEPVSRVNLFDKLAAYQPLDSDEYRELEDLIIAEFSRDLDSLDDLLDQS